MQLKRIIFLSAIVCIVATIAAKNFIYTTVNTFEGYDKAWAVVEKLMKRGYPNPPMKK